MIPDGFIRISELPTTGSLDADDWVLILKDRSGTPSLAIMDRDTLIAQVGGSGSGPSVMAVPAPVARNARTRVYYSGFTGTPDTVTLGGTSQDIFAITPEFLDIFVDSATPISAANDLVVSIGAETATQNGVEVIADPGTRVTAITEQPIDTGETLTVYFVTGLGDPDEVIFYPDASASGPVNGTNFTVVTSGDAVSVDIPAGTFQRAEVLQSSTVIGEVPIELSADAANFTINAGSDPGGFGTIILDPTGTMDFTNTTRVNVLDRNGTGVNYDLAFSLSGAQLNFTLASNLNNDQLGVIEVVTDDNGLVAGPRLTLGGGST
jgi:hypothetical protein